jgi:NAD(P)-dependent dehydrogenase (short-subunit alcohol dehydrogenase family)
VYRLLIRLPFKGHFYLTRLLLPALLKGVPARVVNVASLAHMLSPVMEPSVNFAHTGIQILWDDMHFSRKPYHKWKAYGQSKTSNVLFSVALDRMLASRGIRSFAVHPGVIVTNLQVIILSIFWPVDERFITFVSQAPN